MKNSLMKKNISQIAKTLLLSALLVATILSVPSIVSLAMADEIATLRKGTEIPNIDEEPAPLNNATNDDIKRTRAYPMQPPLIPHKIDNYPINLNANKCISCHDRDRTEESQAPMISVTHFMDRDGNFLAEVSARRYFCTQCHVTQSGAKSLVENTFRDMKEIIVNKKK